MTNSLLDDKAAHLTPRKARLIVLRFGEVLIGTGAKLGNGGAGFLDTCMATPYWKLVFER